MDDGIAEPGIDASNVVALSGNSQRRLGRGSTAGQDT
jgi:hypothetical protein